MLAGSLKTKFIIVKGKFSTEYVGRQGRNHVRKSGLVSQPGAPCGRGAALFNGAPSGKYTESRVQWTRYRFSRREGSGNGICASGRLFGLRRKAAMVVGKGGGIGPKGRPLYVMWALGWGARALRAAK